MRCFWLRRRIVCHQQTSTRCRNQLYLFQKKLSPYTIRQHTAALRFFFFKTLHRNFRAEYIPFPKFRKRLPTILSPEESRSIDRLRSQPFSPHLDVQLIKRIGYGLQMLVRQVHVDEGVFEGGMTEQQLEVLDSFVMVELGSGWTFRGKVYAWPNTRSHAPQQRARRRGQLMGESRPSRLGQPRTFRSVEKFCLVAGLPRLNIRPSEGGTSWHCTKRCAHALVLSPSNLCST